MKQCLGRLYSIYLATPKLYQCSNNKQLINKYIQTHGSNYTYIRRFTTFQRLNQEIKGKPTSNPKNINSNTDVKGTKQTEQSKPASGSSTDAASNTRPSLNLLHNELSNSIVPGEAKVIPEGSCKEDFLTEIFDNLEPYIDTYEVFTRLTEAGFTEAQADSIIKLLIYQLNSKLSKLSTIYAQKYEMESEQYLFESAQQEILVDITRSREQHINELITLVNILERDFNIISDELNNDNLKLRNDSQVAIHEQKSENTLNVKKLFLRIQETNHKITTELDSAIRSEIESLRWYLSRWGLITLLVSLFLASLIFFSNKSKNEKNEAKKEFVPLVIREPSEYDEDDYHTDLDRSSVE
ncbi:hypothetical protein CANMA_004780 [Candida margitis]|uniref:uncharacterized protein n=1 Tax=Candida margitis TaxID=1775924 RepID=UPI00222627BE|nr:uncharacterized protein CANMA_004780 [Candida margitis]KAI5953941.1 hypothetical protein CANMA_004780 [Candida margitis]